MSTQEGTRRKPGNQHDTATCEHISRVLARIADKWTILVVRTLGNGPLRFNALRRAVGEISQKMLSSTLRDLEENGFVSRTVTPTVPPQVEYELTRLGRKFLVPVHGLAGWVATNAKHIDAARAAYARRNERQPDRLPKVGTSLVPRRKRRVEREEQQPLPDD
jgi:DNA-binding HxlR family transcriptional regulator